MCNPKGAMTDKLKKPSSSLPAHILKDRVVQRLRDAARALSLPVAPGVYVFRYRDEVLYVGESKRLRTRVLQYCDSNGHVYGVPGVHIAWLEDADHKTIEKHLIALLRPRLNGKPWTAVYFWRCAALEISNTPDDPQTAALRTAAEALRAIANG